MLPLGVAAAWLLVHRQWPRPRRYGLWWGVPLVALLVVPVYLWADAQTGGEFFRSFLWHHNVERGFGGSDVLRAHPWWFYLPHLAADFLPWSLLLAGRRSGPSSAAAGGATTRRPASASSGWSRSC